MASSLTTKKEVPAVLDDDKISQFRYHALKEQQENRFRISNNVIKSLMHFDSGAFRMFEQIAKRIDLYPLGLLADDNFIAAVSKGETYIPAEYRKVSLRAADYINDFKLNPRSGRVQFTSDAVKLFDQEIPAISLLGEDTVVSTKTRPVTEISYLVQRREKGKSLFIENLDKSDLLNDSGVLAKQASEIQLVLHEKLALAMLFVVERFTRLESEFKSRLSLKANKLYTVLKMTMGSTLMEHGGWWEISWSLNEWNTFLDTEYTSIARLKNSFKLHVELTNLTDLEVQAFNDPDTKQGAKFTRFKLRFRENRHGNQLIEKAVKPLKPERKLKKKPRVKPGSAAHGAWARENLAILIKYEKELKEVGRILPSQDRKRMASYNAILGIKDGTYRQK